MTFFYRRGIFIMALFYIVGVHADLCIADGELVPITPPVDKLGQPWRIQSFLIDSGLDNKNILFTGFDPDGTVWIAASLGLYNFDGYHWRRFTTENGLPSNFVRCVLRASDGKLWVGTDRGAGVFDGVTFRTYGANKNLAGPSVRRIRESSDGAIWFCCDNWPDASVSSGLTRYLNGEWTIYQTEHGLPDNYVSDFFEDSHGRYYALTRQGLAQWQDGMWIRPLEREKLPLSDMFIWGIAETPEAGIIAVTSHCLFRFQNDRWQQIPLDLPNPPGNICSTRDGNLFVNVRIDANNNAFFQWTNDHFQQVSAPFKTPMILMVDNIVEAPDGSIWSSTLDFLTRWNRGGEWREFPDLPANRSFYNGDDLWFVNKNRAVIFDGDRWYAVPGKYWFLEPDPSGSVWGLAEKGVVRWASGSIQYYRETDTGIRNIDLFTLDGSGQPWLYGKDTNGIRAVSKLTGSTWETRQLPQMPDTEIIRSYPDPQSGVWIVFSTPTVGHYRLFGIHDNTVREIPLDPGYRPVFKPIMHVDATQTIWLYKECGLFRLNLQDTPLRWQKIEQIPAEEVFASVDLWGDMWFGFWSAVGGPSGLARLHDGIWSLFDLDVRNFGYKVSRDKIVFGGEDDRFYVVSAASGGNPVCLSVPRIEHVSGMLEDKNGNLWIQNSNTTYCYRPDEIMPDTIITAPVLRLYSGSRFNVHLSAVEKFSPRQTKRVFTYSWRFEDGDWSDFQPAPEQGLSIDGLSSGQHLLQVKARDEGMDVDSTPAELWFTIHSIPIQERKEFLPTLLGVIVLLVFLTVYAYYAKKKIDRYALRLECTNTLLHGEIEERKQMELEIKASLREKEILLREIHHRVKNNLQIVSSLLQLHSDAVDDPRFVDVFKDCRTRIHSMSLIHEKLYKTNDFSTIDFSDYIHNLVDSIFMTYLTGPNSITKVIDVDTIQLNLDTAIPCGLIINELVTNSLKHAFPEGRTGEIFVSLKLIDSGAFHLSVRDNGIGLSDGFDLESVSTIGLQIVNILVKKIKGTIKLKYEMEGTHFSITFHAPGG